MKKQYVKPCLKVCMVQSETFMLAFSQNATITELYSNGRDGYDEEEKAASDSENEWTDGLW